MSEDDMFQLIAAGLIVWGALTLWAWRPTRVVMVVAIMALWGAVSVAAPLYFAAQHLAEGHPFISILTLAAAGPIAALYLGIGWPAFVKFWRSEVVTRRQGNGQR